MIRTAVTGAVFFFSKKDHRQDDKEEEQLSKQTNLLCRFVFDGTGTKMGETVSLDGDIVIIKNGKKYLGVPVKHLEEEGKTLMVKGLVDVSKAEELGEHWRQQQMLDDLEKDVNHEKRNGRV